MSDAAKSKREGRVRRHRRIRKKVAGSASRPRLAIYRSNRHIHAQIIDDIAGKTLVAASTVEAAVRGGATGNATSASQVGTTIAERAKAAGITEVVFDRGGFLYHGRVAALADAARAGGLEF